MDDNDDKKYVDLEFKNTPTTREEAVFGPDEEDTLFDAYQMLRWVGVPKRKLGAMAVTIELMTIYDRDDLEQYFERVATASPTFEDRLEDE
jgi:hypothetical protein